MPFSLTGPYHRRPATFVVITGLAILILAVYIFSLFLDDIIRSRTEATMKRTLKGYQVSLAGAHLQILDGSLSLKRLTIVQLAHPTPPVADVELVSFHIDWRDLFFGRIVAELLLSQPRLHIDQAQLASESPSKIKYEG
jgi:hypothetical protein